MTIDRVFFCFCFCLLYCTEESTTSEAFTVADIASSSVPLTTFETYDVENTTAENVTLEFVDLPTTEAISSTSNIAQYLETANYKAGTYTFEYKNNYQIFEVKEGEKKRKTKCGQSSNGMS